MLTDGPRPKLQETLSLSLTKDYEHNIVMGMSDNCHHALPLYFLLLSQPCEPMEGQGLCLTHL